RVYLFRHRLAGQRPQGLCVGRENGTPTIPCRQLNFLHSPCRRPVARGQLVVIGGIWYHFVRDYALRSAALFSFFRRYSAALSQIEASSLSPIRSYAIAISISSML